MMALDWTELVASFGRMSMAAALAVPIAFHPIRFRRRSTKRRVRDIAKAQLLVCVAGTLMVVVIGDNLARAFALVGLGSFIRFRTVVKSSADAAVMFLLIGIGMAVGLEHYALSIVAMVFVFVLVAIFEWLVPDLFDPEDAPAHGGDRSSGARRRRSATPPDPADTGTG